MIRRRAEGAEVTRQGGVARTPLCGPDIPNALNVPKAAAKGLKRRKKPQRLLPTPKPLPERSNVSLALLAEGRLAVAVTLTGAHSHGDVMVLDEGQWPRIKLAFGELWGIRAMKGRRYVMALGARRGFVLARWIAGAQAGEVVSYRNGDSLDLRRSNLVVIGRQEFVAGVFGHLDGTEGAGVS